MSFRVNTNVSAMSALRNLGITNMELSRSITRLSTGLRINSAADDPAGLIISENFRAQLSGIDQAIRNNQDAINYAKTAEGALDEVSRLLRDARALAVGAANSGLVSASQAQAYQTQLQSIVDSVTRIAEQTQFGTKKILDGSSGVTAAVTNGTNIASVSLTGSLGTASGAQAITANAGLDINVTTAATQATALQTRVIAVADVATAEGTTVAQAGSFTINGTTVTVGAADTYGDVIQKINDISGSTGVTATLVLNGANDVRVQLKTQEYGSNATIDITDANGVIRSAAGSASAAGVDAVATVTIGALSATFTGGLNGTSGLLLKDSQGNIVQLTAAGNTTGAVAGVAQVLVGSAQFQIGANPNQTTQLSIGNFAASQLGTGAVSGKNLSNLDLTSTSGANDAMLVIDAAIEQVTKSRGDIGSFHRNVLESNIRSLGVARENLAATESAIRDVDVAAEMTNFTKLQILQQAGMAVLAQANAAPQTVLSLMR